MRHALIVIAVSFLTGIVLTPAQAQWVKMNGPYAGMARSLAVCDSGVYVVVNNSYVRPEPGVTRPIYDVPTLKQDVEPQNQSRHSRWA